MQAMTARPVSEQTTRRVPPRQRKSEAGRRYETALLRRYATTRAPEARNELVASFMPLARSLALRYARRAESLDDLIGVANLGLVISIDGFDP